MIPILYDKTGTIKLGELTNCIECLVEEERNGLFEVSLIYPINDTLFNSLEEENIIVCNANDTLLNQKFRIYMTRKLMSNKIEVFARHISFDLAYDYINNIDIKNQSCEYALNTIFRNSQFSTHYKGYSDIINAQNYKISKVNCIEAIGGTSGSIIDTFGTGAEILRDNTNIHVLNKRGHDNGVSIEYAKNLTGFELEEDYSELITRIIPFATYSNSEANEDILVEANAVDSDYINNYSHPYISYMDFSDKFEDEEIPTTSKLIELARKYFKENECDKPKQNFKIEFIPLSKCVGYEGIQDNISLCDTVTIKDTRYNIDTKSKVIKTVFDVLKNRYESMELGEPRTTLGDIINSSSGGESGEQGPPGPQGPPGADGSIGDFPNSLPSTPVLSANVYGFSTIELNWTYENKVYYNYELYGSKTKDFTPNTFDLIHAGQTSSYLFQAKPNETWYFRVCAVNTHGERTPFSSQVTVNTVKIDDLSNYVENAAIGDALIDTLNLGRGWYGELRGNYIDAKQLSVTDGNGKRTLDIDSFGNVSLDVTNLKISSKGVATNESVKSDIEKVKGNILKEVQEVNLSVSNLSDTMNGAFKDGIVTDTELKLISERINQLNKEKEDIDSQYSIIYSNPDLTGTVKTNLKKTKTNYDNIHTNLVNYINTIISDNKVTGDEKYTLKTKMNSYSASLAGISASLQEAIDSIGTKKKNDAIESAESKVNEAKAEIKLTTDSINQRVENTEKETIKINGNVVNISNRLNVAEEKITDESIIQTVSSTIDKRVVNNLIYNSSVLSNLTGFKTLGGEIRRFDSMEKIKVEENVPVTEISIPSKPPQTEIDIPPYGNIKGEEYDEVIIKPPTIIPKPVKTRMHFILTVDCGDCILIETDCGKNILIDGVDNRLISSSTYKDSTTPIMDYLDKVGITKLDYVICTHFHSDHAGALPTIMDKYCSKTSKLIYNNISDSAINSISNEVSWKTTTYKANVLNKAKSLGVETISPSNNTSFTLDSNTKFRICKSSVTSGFTSYNATSLVTVFEYKNTKVALTSDITVEVQEELKDVIGKCDIVKDVHHGYNSWISANFIKTTNPKDIIVTRNHDWGTGSKRACNSVGMWQSYEKNIYPLWYANNHILIDFIGNDYTISTSKRFYFENCWLKFEDNNDLWCYFKQGGHYAKNETLILEGKKYHFSDKGYCINPYNPE